MQCEKCENEATTLVVDQPDYIHDQLAGWFMCEECFALDPDGWYEVLDATVIDTVDVLPAKAVKKRPAPRAKAPAKPKTVVHRKRADDELIAHAYELHTGGMKLADVAREVMKVHPYKNVASACASLRTNFKARGWEVTSSRRTAVAA